MIALLTHRNGCGGANLGSKYPNVVREALNTWKGDVSASQLVPGVTTFDGSKEMTLNELPLRNLHSEVRALRGHSEQLETVLPFGRFRKLFLYSTPRKLQATWLGLAVAHAFLELPTRNG